MTNEPTPTELWQQLIAAQETLMHLQHELNQMHDAILAQRNDILELTRRQGALEHRFESGAAEDLPPALEDRPPHY